MLEDLAENFCLIFFPVLEDFLDVDQVRLELSHVPRVVILWDLLLSVLGKHLVDVNFRLFL